MEDRWWNLENLENMDARETDGNNRVAKTLEGAEDYGPNLSAIPNPPQSAFPYYEPVISPPQSPPGPPTNEEIEVERPKTPS